MIVLLVFGGYALGIVLGLLIVAWRKARGLQRGSDADMESMAAFMWPLTLIILFGYVTVWVPGEWGFNKAVEGFTPKPPKPKKQPEVDETKSSYRSFDYK